MAVEKYHDHFVLSDDVDRIDFEIVHSWLASTYWSPGISRERVERAAKHSTLLVGVYEEDRQVGYLRVVSDTTRFAYICDVFVDESARKRGIAKAMVRYALSHPDHDAVDRWILATRDAHDVYRECGFGPLPIPENWLVKGTFQPR